MRIAFFVLASWVFASFNGLTAVETVQDILSLLSSRHGQRDGKADAVSLLNSQHAVASLLLASIPEALFNNLGLKHRALLSALPSSSRAAAPFLQREGDVAARVGLHNGAGFKRTMVTKGDWLCTKCGMKNDKAKRFCGRCGDPCTIKTPKASHTATLNAGDWLCHVCGHPEAWYKTTCSLCNAPRTAPVAFRYPCTKPGDTYCSQCAAMVPGMLFYCSRCLTPLPQRDKGDRRWRCTGCMRLQEHWRTVCQICGALKPSDEYLQEWREKEEKDLKMIEPTIKFHVPVTEFKEGQESNDRWNWKCPVCYTSCDREAWICERCGYPNPRPELLEKHRFPMVTRTAEVINQPSFWSRGSNATRMPLDMHIPLAERMKNAKDKWDSENKWDDDEWL